MKIFPLNFSEISSIFNDADNETRKAIISISRRVGIYSFLRKWYVLVGGKPNSPHTADLALKQALLSLDDLSPNAKRIYFRLTEDESSHEDKV
jgi:hypothetical protein